MRRRPRLVRGAIIAIGLCSVGILLLTVPDKALAWTGALFTAALAGLGQQVWGVADGAIKRRREARELESGEPFTTDVKIKNTDYIAFADGDRIEHVPASGHTVQLVLTGTLAVPVLLTDLQVDVISRRERSGNLSRHAAEVPRRQFDALLDARPPQVRARADSDFPYKIKQHESEAFDLKIITESGDVQWVLWLDWRAGRRSGRVQVDLGGRPFRTAGRDVGQSVG